MSTATVDINKSAIMTMLNTDLFGFQPKSVEEQAKDVFHLVGGQNSSPGGYVRNREGYIIVTMKDRSAAPAGGKKKKK